MEKTPYNINIDEIKKHLIEIDGVTDIHHIHIRSIDGYNNFATMHVIVREYSHEIKERVKEELREHGICHSTIELELEDEDCNDENCEIHKHEEEHHHHHHHH